jgi:hypothetical protein
MLACENIRLAVTTTVCSVAFLAGCNKPLYVWQAHLNSTPKSPSFEVSTLANERVIILAPAAHQYLQGYVPSVSQALSAACAEVSPPVRALSNFETVNKLTEQGLSIDYVEEKPDYAPSRILDRQQLQRLHKGLAAQYVLQPGLAQFSESLEDSFEFSGLKLIKKRINSLVLWLRLWNAETGDFVWEGAGEATVASTLLEEQSSLALHDMARRLWILMLQETLLGGKTKTVRFSKEHVFGGER